MAGDTKFFRQFALAGEIVKPRIRCDQILCPNALCELLNGVRGLGNSAFFCAFCFLPYGLDILWLLNVIFIQPMVECKSFMLSISFRLPFCRDRLFAVYIISFRREPDFISW